MSTELLFIRHGETDWNRQQRFQGQIDVPLNAVGQAQAERLAARLVAERYDGLFTSDLARARQTAAPLAVAWRLQPVAVTALREQSFGVLEGLTLTEVKERHAALWQRWLEHDADFALPRGESLRRFNTRVMTAVRELAAEAPARRLAIVTHGGVLDMLWRSAHGLSLSGLRACNIPNTGVNRLRWAGGTLHIDRWADDEHLAGLPPQPSTAAAGEP
ncbi:MAG: histidine phosphatase family protein [Rubrivivax sp.]|nr:histidine phosphatase family protein [Rubrivivax sp.]